MVQTKRLRNRVAAAVGLAAISSAATGCFALSLDGKGQFDNPMNGARISNLEARVHALEQVVMPGPAPHPQLVDPAYPE